MIPKTIHYCWFGKSNFNETIKTCIDSWEKYCPDYNIKCWNEENSPMYIPWIKTAMKHKKYAFVADYVRFYALFCEGGVYLDTDMLLIKDISPLLNNKLFLGMEEASRLNMAIIGSCANNHIIEKIIQKYDSLKFDMVNPPVITKLLTPIFSEIGFEPINKIQKFDNNITIYPVEYFYPIPFKTKFELHEIDNYLTSKTFGVHLWNASWKSEFTLIEEGTYLIAFKMIYRRFKKNPLLPLKYYLTLIKSIMRVIKYKGMNLLSRK